MEADTPNNERPPILFDKTQPIIEALEKQLGGKFLAYWMSYAGSLCQNDVNVFSEILKTLGNCERLFIFIKSGGGNGSASLRMVNLLRSHCEKITALVPLNCESAATMLALGADEIHMGPMAYLTPVDTKVYHDLLPIDNDNDRVRIGTNELERILQHWKLDEGENNSAYEQIYKYLHPLAIAAVQRAGSLSNMLCNEIMSYHIDDETKRKTISHTLNADYPSHSYPIVLKEAQRIGISAVPLDLKIDKLLIELNEVYSEIGKKCRTDFSPHHHRDNEIINIIECRSRMIYFELDKEWHYSEAERTWRSTNERSLYRIRDENTASLGEDTPFYIR